MDSLGWGPYIRLPGHHLVPPQRTVRLGGYSMGPVWSNRFEGEEMGTFLKVKTREGLITWFREGIDNEGDPVWVNPNGGEWHRRSQDEILMVQEAARFEDLDWRGTYIEMEDSVSGWLAPDGTFYRCRPENHDAYAKFILRREVSDLNREGWVDVKNSSSWRSAWSMSLGEAGKPLTPAQRDWLSSNGHMFDSRD